MSKRPTKPKLLTRGERVDLIIEKSDGAVPVRHRGPIGAQIIWHILRLDGQLLCEQEDDGELPQRLDKYVSHRCPLCASITRYQWPEGVMNKVDPQAIWDAADAYLASDEYAEVSA